MYRKYSMYDIQDLNFGTFFATFHVGISIEFFLWKSKNKKRASFKSFAWKSAREWQLKRPHGNDKLFKNSVFQLSHGIRNICLGKL